MRKRDVVLLSVLALYDYGAQSLRFSNATDLVSFCSNITFHDNQLTDPELSFQPVFNDQEASVVRGIKRLNTVPSSEIVLAKTEQKNISYHALAKINVAATTVATESEYNDINTAVHISTPDPFVADIALPETLSSTVAEETNRTFAIASVSTSFVALSSPDQIEVKDEANDGSMQFADTDADGMFNFEDKCPGIAGVARFEGCPVPDSDDDGVNDEEDRCPFVKGSELNGGCAETESPTTTLDANNSGNDGLAAADYLTVVQFKADSEVLSNKDFNIILQLADKIINNPGARVDVLKLTDSSSTIKANTLLSYLRDLGVKDSQINVTAIDSATSAANTSVAVQIRH